jgi:hypothetical protein
MAMSVPGTFLQVLPLPEKSGCWSSAAIAERRTLSSGSIKGKVRSKITPQTLATSSPLAGFGPTRTALTFIVEQWLAAQTVHQVPTPIISYGARAVSSKSRQLLVPCTLHGVGELICAVD